MPLLSCSHGTYRQRHLPRSGKHRSGTMERGGGTGVGLGLTRSCLLEAQAVFSTSAAHWNLLRGLGPILGDFNVICLGCNPGLGNLKALQLLLMCSTGGEPPAQRGENGAWDHGTFSRRGGEKTDGETFALVKYEVFHPGQFEGKACPKAFGLCLWRWNRRKCKDNKYPLYIIIVRNKWDYCRYGD